ncbi:MAG TPA: hypothetical protein VLE74_03845 [Candidatus Saccharimonadales bacterium]|nr:hypothetical protein [Candidatus Saccharimonadales bacterium]
MPFQPAPLEHDPHQTVENVHPDPAQPGQDIPDYESRAEMETFLEERMRGDQSGLRQVLGRWRVYNPVERMRWRFGHMWYLHADPEPANRLVTDGRSWLRTTAIGLLACNVVVNVADGNIKNLAADVIEEVQGVKDSVQDAWKMWGHDVCPAPSSRTTETVIRTNDTETYYLSPNMVGESNPKPSLIDQLLDKVKAAQSDSTVTRIAIEDKGNTSDEWLGLGSGQNYGYGQDEPENEALGTQRADDEAALLRQVAADRGVNLSGIEIDVTHQQNTLDQQTQTQLETLVSSHGYGSLQEVQRIHNDDPASLPADVRDAFDYYFGDKRATQLKLEVHKEIRSTVTIETPAPNPDKDCVTIDGRPADHKHDYKWPLVPFLWPALPIAERRRITKMKGTPLDLGDIDNPQRLLIHEDGVHADGTLDEFAAAYTRKLIYLFREDGRIRKAYQYNYPDEHGETQSLRAIFVDHDPTPEAVELVHRTFRLASQLQGGRIGRECTMVAISNRENAGLHGDAKRVGLGLDVQHPASTLGVAIPSLGFVEMHVPAKPTDGELDQDYNSQAWVLAHELLGHFTQLNDQPNQLHQAGHNANGRPVYTLPNRFEYFSMGQYRRAQRETDRANSEAGGWFRRVILRRPRGAESMRWRTRRGLGTLPTPDTADEYIDGIRGTDDRALREALRVKKQTGNPTIYGSGLAHGNERVASLEADAEAAANKATSHITRDNTRIAIPFMQAPEYSAHTVLSRDPERFIDGYDVSDSWDATLDGRWGTQTANGEATILPPEGNTWRSYRLDVPENFDWARELAAWARSVDIPEPNDDVWTEIIVNQALQEGRALKTQIEAERAKRKILV